MLTLYGNAFSPFARKVQIILDHKGIEYENIDGLTPVNRERLAQVNRRIEVPAIDHDGLIVVNSADIAAYLERVFPEHPIYPVDTATWVKARAWERCADTTIDPILVDISYWLWAIRPDQLPEGLLDAARADLASIYEALNAELRDRDWVCGELSIADIALFPHLSGARTLQVPFDESRYPDLFAWYKRCRSTPIFANDLARTRTFMSNPASFEGVERNKIFWRGDRIEWILARGYHDWFMKEIQEGRVLWPAIGVPA
ncbi:MAG: glutathione S-transferase family protein [Deltaproteobacteria bacterium]|nr:glutathione S-transferase family protein [Deltaproteobacteria bacterium]